MSRVRILTPETSSASGDCVLGMSQNRSSIPTSEITSFYAAKEQLIRGDRRVDQL